MKIIERKLKSNSLLEILERTIRKDWKKPAYSDYGSDTSFTYGDVAKNMMRLHSIFKELGPNRATTLLSATRTAADGL